MMTSWDKTPRDAGVAVVALVLAVVIGIGAAVGVTFGLVSMGSSASQSPQPLVTYNSQ